MKHIVKALRTTYSKERKAWSGLRDLINLLEDEEDDYERIELIKSIEDGLEDIQQQG